MGQISKRVVVEYTHQPFVYNFQKPVCRYLLKRLRSKRLTVLAILKKVNSINIFYRQQKLFKLEEEVLIGDLIAGGHVDGLDLPVT